MDGKMSNNKRLYKSAFSRLHASAEVITEDDIMHEKNECSNKNNCVQAAVPVGRSARRRGRLRISRSVAVCAAAAALICIMSVGTFAATGGETANPIQAVRVMLNGQAVSADAVKSDGSISTDMNGGDELSCEDPETGESVNVKMGEDGGRVRISRSDAGMDVKVDVDQDGSGGLSMSVGSGAGDGQETQGAQETDDESSREAQGTDAGHKNGDNADDNDQRS